MTDQELVEVVSGILRNRVPEAGFEGAEVVSDLDSDGDPVIRVTAHYKRRPQATPDPLLGAAHAIRSVLLAHGEDRFILLKNDVLEERDQGEETD